MKKLGKFGDLQTQLCDDNHFWDKFKRVAVRMF